MGEGRTLYVGVDDSNHAGEIPGEIFVVTFSYDSKYINRSKIMGNTRCGISNVEKFLEGGGDFRFTIRTPETFTHSKENAAIVGPTLILNYFKEKNLYGSIDECFVDVDGGLCPKNKRLLGYDLGHLEVPEILVHNFTKNWQGKISRWKDGREKNKNDRENHKGYRGCELVWLADGIAHKILEEYRIVGLEEMEKRRRCYPEKFRLKKGIWTIMN